MLATFGTITLIARVISAFITGSATVVFITFTVFFPVSSSLPGF